MQDKISQKIAKKIANIINLKAEISKWRKKSEDEVTFLLKEFEKTPRDELSLDFARYFNDDDFAKILLELASFYPNNKKITLSTISALANMALRYELTQTSEIYNLILSCSNNIGISAYVYIYLPRLNGFKEHTDKWGYFMSMRAMSPKKVAHAQLVSVICENLDSIPSRYKAEVIDKNKSLQITMVVRDFTSR